MSSGSSCLRATRTAQIKRGLCAVLSSAVLQPSARALPGFLVLFLSLCLLPCPSRPRGKRVGFPPIYTFLAEKGFPSLGTEGPRHRLPAAKEWPRDWATGEKKIETSQQEKPWGFGSQSGKQATLLLPLSQDWMARPFLPPYFFQVLGYI